MEENVVNVESPEDRLSCWMACKWWTHRNEFIIIPAEYCMISGRFAEKKAKGAFTYSVVSYKKTQRSIKIKAKPIRSDVRICSTIPKGTVLLSNMIDHMSWRGIDDINNVTGGSITFRTFEIEKPIEPNSYGNPINIIVDSGIPEESVILSTEAVLNLVANTKEFLNL